MQHRLRVDMVGRERERAELADALLGARAGRGSVKVLLGEAGMGKSTLVAWTVTRATEATIAVAQGHCSAAGMPALWAWRRVLATLAPDFAWRDEGAVAAASDRELLAASVVEAVAAAAARRPLLIVLEDLHWADAASLIVLQAVAEAVPGLPAVVVATVRDDPGEVSPDIRSHLAQLPTHARRMSLLPLHTDSIAALAATVLNHDLSDRDIAQLRDRTGGNPFFVHEVLRLQAAHGAPSVVVVPPGVSEVIERRVARVSQRCAAMLGRAAVAAETSAGVIERDLVRNERGDVDALLDEAVAAGLLDAGPLDHTFRHALVRETIVGGLSAAERRRLNGEIAHCLESRTPTSPERLARHWSEADGALAQSRSAFWSVEAARIAVTEFGFESAIDHFRRALATSQVDQIAVGVELGQALQLAGDTEAAREVLLDAARRAERDARPIDLAKAALALGGGLAGFEVPIADEVQSAVLSRADELLPQSAPGWRAAVRGRLSLAQAGIVSPTDRIAMAEDAVRLARAAGDPTVESAVLAAYCDAIPGPDYVRERIEAAERMVTLSESRGQLHDQVTLLLARRLLLVALIEAGELGAAELQALAYERIAARLGIALYKWLPEIWRGMRALLVGDVATAFACADKAEHIGRRAHSFNAELMVFTLRLQAHLDGGSARRFSSEVRGVLDQIVPLGMPAMYLAGPARFLLATGDAGPARSVLRAFASGDRHAMPKDAEWLESHWAIADIAIELDDKAAVADLYATLLPCARLWAVDGIGGAVFGAVAEQLGRLAAHIGRADDAREHFATAAGQYRRQGTTALLARLRDRSGAVDTNEGEGRLLRNGATWQLQWRGRRSVVADAKGLHDLAALVARPGEPIPAAALVEAAGGPSTASVGGSLGPVLDDTARRAYRARLTELDHDLDEAETDADLGRAERIRAERDMLIAELAAAVGLGGRDRIAGDPADRARKAVTMRIRAAIRVIESHDPELARHLTNAVHTGRYCSYRPESPVHWQT
jgi:tetratricopeptide (TPR) repeat protein